MNSLLLQDPLLISYRCTTILIKSVALILGVGQLSSTYLLLGVGQLSSTYLLATAIYRLPIDKNVLGAGGKQHFLKNSSISTHLLNVAAE